MNRFTSGQLQTIVDICVGVGLIGFGSITIPVFLGSGSVFQIIAGLTISLVFGILQ